MFAFTIQAVAHDKPDGLGKKFLLLYSAHSMLAANLEATSGVSSVFESAVSNNYDVYAEYRDARRFPGQDFDQQFAETIIAKYKDVELDVIMAFGLPALQFTIRHHDEFAPDVPVVFGGVDSQSIQDSPCRQNSPVLSASTMSVALWRWRALSSRTRNAW
jgi:hypothetical protein